MNILQNNNNNNNNNNERRSSISTGSSNDSIQSINNNTYSTYDISRDNEHDQDTHVQWTGVVGVEQENRGEMSEEEGDYDPL